MVGGGSPFEKIKPPRKPTFRERFEHWWEWHDYEVKTTVAVVAIVGLLTWGIIAAYNAGWFDKMHLHSGQVIGKSHNIEYVTTKRVKSGKTWHTRKVTHPEAWKITVQNGNTLESWTLTKDQWDAIIEGETVTWGEFHEDKAAEEAAEGGVDADSTETPGLLPDGEKPQGMGQ